MYTRHVRHTKIAPKLNDAMLMALNNVKVPTASVPLG